MNRFALVLIALLFSKFKGFSQNCGTETPTTAHFNWLENLHHDGTFAPRSELDTVLRIPLRAFLVSTTNGDYLNPSNLLVTVCELNQKYAHAGISFYWDDEPIILNGTTFNPLINKTDGSTMMSTYNLDSVVNIYYTDLNSQGLCGYAYYPNSGPSSGGVSAQGGAVMSGSCSGPGNTTLAHELGHYFSLPHPFD
ncbi:MAG: hypothetical protein EBZ62_02470, partial [Sphingobacteriia bacterium]|nr:hypothetical protein [Sphingobacteriia bacterium]